MSPSVQTTSKFSLICAGCGNRFPADTTSCPRCPGALLRAEYVAADFEPLDRGDLFRFLPWLPVRVPVDTGIGPVVYAAEKLADHLRMKDLRVGFNGYAPELGARNATGSFKDYEALPTLLSFRERGLRTAVLASVGNSARAFAHAAVSIGFPVTIVVPESVLSRLWLPMPPTEAVRLIVLEESNDYASAIRVSAAFAERSELPSEGGARNIARRDGMGTVMLEHARAFGELPRHYVQAVSSGTGGIAAWEASMRLIGSGQFGDRLPQLHLVQNKPFSPLHDAWSRGVPIRPDENIHDQLRRINAIAADVLANRNPPFAIPGGVRDALRATNGSTYAVSNSEIENAQRLFMECEGVPIGPESGAALAALRQALAGQSIGPDESVLLNVTGNNESLIQRDYEIHPIKPWRTIPPEHTSGDALERWIDRASEEFQIA